MSMLAWQNLIHNTVRLAVTLTGIVGISAVGVVPPAP